MIRQMMVSLSIQVAVAAAVAASSSPVFEHIDSRDGLAHNSIATILQDRLGFLWIGTLGGLNRFDGVEFVVWRHDSQDSESLSSNNVTALLEDRTGKLWIGTDQGLDWLERYGWQGGRFHHFFDQVEAESTISSPVRVLFEDRQGLLWAGLSRGLVRCAVGEGRVDDFSYDPGNPRSLAPGSVYGIQQDGSGALWVLTVPEGRETRPALNRLDLDGSGFDRFPAPDGWKISGFLIDRDGRFWLNTAGLGSFDPALARFERPLLHREHAPLSELWQDRDGAVWISTVQGFLRYQPHSGDVAGPWPPVAAEDRLAGFAGHFVEDREGTVWLGTRGGIYKWDPRGKPFHHVGRRSGEAGSLSSDRISSVLEDTSGTLWLGTYGAGLNQLAEPGAPTVHYQHDPGDPSSLCHDTVWHVAEDPGGDLWLGVGDGLCRYQRSTDRFRRYPLDPPTPLHGVGGVRFVVPAASGELWLATDTGLFRFDPDTAKARHRGSHEPGGPGHRLIHTLYLEEGGSLWSGPQGGGLEELVVASGSWVQHTLATEAGYPIRSEGIFAIHPEGDGSLWLGSGDGLSRYHPASGELDHYSARHGLPGSSVYSILEDDQGRLWLGTDQGLSRFDERQPPGSRFRNFDLSDGIGNLEFNRHAAARTRDGRFLFGGMNGLTSLTPDEIRTNSAVPSVALTQVRVWTREGDSVFHPGAPTELVLSPRQNSVAFEFATLDFTHGARNRYAYRLEGFDDDWIDNGTRRLARYHRLPPGRYRLRVKAGSNDRRWNQREAVQALRILPPYWQTWWFRSVMLSALVAALVAVHRSRVGRLLEIERLRTRIAGDLHDDLSSELSGIALAMEVLEQRRSDDRHEPRLAQVRERALEMLDRLRDIVWCVNPEHDNQEALIRRMRSVAETLLVDRRHRFEASLPGDSEIPLTLRRNLLLIYKEALHNAVRHSDAHRIEIRITDEDGWLLLTVVDDGVGFEVGSDHAGYGLKSMRRRALEMGAALRVRSRPGSGSEVKLKVRMPRWGRPARSLTHDARWQDDDAHELE